jgi:hypothetical protein
MYFNNKKCGKLKGWHKSRENTNYRTAIFSNYTIYIIMYRYPTYSMI